jgi:hypothetical protein
MSIKRKRKGKREEIQKKINIGGKKCPKIEITITR